METTYERHQREYTILGITSVIDAMVGKTLQSVYGTTLADLISVVKDGTYWHFQLTGDRERVSRAFLKKVAANNFNLEEEYKRFDQEVAEFEKILYAPETDFNLKTFLDFFNYYQSLFPIAYAGMDSADFADELQVTSQESYVAWATKVRLRGEVIYKDGEMKFLPRYTKWLAKNIFTDYSAEELRYLTGLELRDYILNQQPLPTPAVLHDRKTLLFIQQTALSQTTLLQGQAAIEKITELKLLEQPEDEVTAVRELKGKTAFPGIVRGLVRIVRTRQDMANFKDNEIIVSGMTDPSYLPIMKRAAAFVTNEGGLLCHAAIVARELKKPCVIGTKFATHAFKEGEMIEVDATAGLVRRLA